MKLFLLVLAIGLGALSIVTPAESEVCYDGCASISLSVGDYVILTNPSTGSNCSACGSGNVTLSDIQKVDNCGYCTAPTCPTGTFCTTGSPTATNYVVQSIGAGCSGSPQGCVRLCPCP